MALSLNELRTFAKEFVANLPRAVGAEAHIVGLKGELGSGKTTFVQMIAEELGIQDPVTSPTFTILQVYPINHPVFERLIHVDAYRLSREDSDTIGFQQYRENPRNLILVEWPENLRDFPQSAARITFRVLDTKTRAVEHHAP